MDSSRRAVETYWRSRMIDAATSDEDKVTPVYKLEEICELLRSSHVSIVKEVSEFVFKRLEHRSPIVKQKALRLIKYAVGKSGTEFRREMQRNSVAVRQLFHYKGQVDPLKGDALNKAVRDTAHEAISAIFSEDDSKLQPAENLNRRIEGFGNTNFEMPSDDKKSFLSEVVGIGSATIKQGLNSFTQAQSLRKNDTGSYKSPTLRRSLTTEIDYPDRYDRVEHHNESQGTSRFSKNAISGPWRQDLKVKQPETTNGDSISSSSESKTREERLLETIVTSGGVRLQPTRDVLQVFLVEASKLDAFALGHAIESKLQSPLWQVRMKAVCVLEAILRKKDEEQFSTIASYFSENIDSVVRCSESPQSSLREKATKVLGLLDRDQTGSKLGHLEKPVKAETVVEVPDLIDTGDIDDLLGTEDSVNLQGDQSVANPTSTTNLMEDLLGDGLGAGVSTSEQKNDDDPFADVSFHTGNDKEHVADLFSAASDFSTAKTKNEAELFDIFGSNTDLPLKQENPGKDVKPGASDKHVVDKPGASDFSTAKTKNEPELFDIFGSNTDLPLKQENPGKDVNDLMAGFSINENASFLKQTGATFGSVTETIFSNTPINPSSQGSNDVLNGILGSQAAGMNANTLFPLGHTPYNLSSGVTFSPAFPSQPMNYGAMGSLFAQQQFLATMSNFQQLGNFQSQNGGLSHAAGTKADGYSSPLPDIFNPAIPAQIPSSMVNSSKKEETRAFDFISDHLASARDPKRVI